MNTKQLELTFAPATAGAVQPPIAPRASRARWWFTQMRRAVDRAFPRMPGLTPPPEQTCLTLSRPM